MKRSSIKLSKGFLPLFAAWLFSFILVVGFIYATFPPQILGVDTGYILYISIAFIFIVIQYYLTDTSLDMILLTSILWWLISLVAFFFLPFGFFEQEKDLK